MEGEREERKKREGGKEGERGRKRGRREGTYQRGPVSVQVSYSESRHELSEGNNEKIEIQEKLELLKENLRT